MELTAVSFVVPGQRLQLVVSKKSLEVSLYFCGLSEQMNFKMYFLFMCWEIQVHRNVLCHSIFQLFTFMNKNICRTRAKYKLVCSQACTHLKMADFFLPLSTLLFEVVVTSLLSRISFQKKTYAEAKCAMGPKIVENSI